MHIGVFFPGFISDQGGAFTFEQEMLKALVKLASTSSHRFTLFFDASSFCFAKTLTNYDHIEKVILQLQMPAKEERNLWLKIFDKMKRGLKTNSEVVRGISPFQKEINERKIDLIWFPTSVYLPVDDPFIATVWDIQHRSQPWFPEVSKNGLWVSRETYYAKYLRKASFILACNNTARQEISFYYQIPEVRFRLLPHPTPTIEHIPSAEEVKSVLDKYLIKKPYLLYPAQFWAHKNHINLLKAQKILLDEYRMDFQLVLVGSEQGNKLFVQKMVGELGLEESVKLLGFIPKEDLVALYCGAFALSYVTYFGPENLPPLEAFVCKCPVIASRVPGAEEQLGDAAILVNGSKPDEIAQAVRRLEVDPELRNFLIEKGQIRAAQFTSLDYVKGVFSLLDEFELVRRNWGN